MSDSGLCCSVVRGPFGRLLKKLDKKLARHPNLRYNAYIVSYWRLNACLPRFSSYRLHLCAADAGAQPAYPTKEALRVATLLVVSRAWCLGNIYMYGNRSGGGKVLCALVPHSHRIHSQQDVVAAAMVLYSLCTQCSRNIQQVACCATKQRRVRVCFNSAPSMVGAVCRRGVQ